MSGRVDTVEGAGRAGGSLRSSPGTHALDANARGEVVRGRGGALATLVALTLLPLAVIGVQLALGLNGMFYYSLYKIAFVVPPVVYCYLNGIRVPRDVLKFRNWRNGLAVALGLGAAGLAIFWGAYWLLGDLLLDKAKIVAKIEAQFSVTARTVLVVAPVTILANSLLEEFFYRGFAFGLLRRRNRLVAYLVPAAAFTVQHLLFIYHWVTPLPFALAVGGLFIFALVAAKLYEATDTIVAPWVAHLLGDVAMMGIAVGMIYSEGVTSG